MCTPLLEWKLILIIWTLVFQFPNINFLVKKKEGMEQRLLSDGQIRAGVTTADNSGNLDLPVQGKLKYLQSITIFPPNSAMDQPSHP